MICVPEERFGRFVVIGCDPDRRNWFLCKCDCGNIKSVRCYSLKNGDSTSCGCFRLEKNKAINTTHGMGRTREYAIWCGMKNRCNNPNVKAYPRYGGVGIMVCQEWQNSFENFYRDMGQCPKGFSIERKDNSLGYEPNNCIWADDFTQNQNKKNVRMVVVSGETMPWTVAAKRVKVSHSSIQNFIKKNGASMQDTINYFSQRQMS